MAKVKFQPVYLKNIAPENLEEVHDGKVYFNNINKKIYVKHPDKPLELYTGLHRQEVKDRIDKAIKEYNFNDMAWMKYIEPGVKIEVISTIPDILYVNEEYQFIFDIKYIPSHIPVEIDYWNDITFNYPSDVQYYQLHFITDSSDTSITINNPDNFSNNIVPHIDIYYNYYDINPDTNELQQSDYKYINDLYEQGNFRYINNGFIFIPSPEIHAKHSFTIQVHVYDYNLGVMYYDDYNEAYPVEIVGEKTIEFTVANRE